jgi:hypothetical protein
MVAAAVVGGAVVGAVATKSAADTSASASRDASTAQKAASDAQLAFQQQQYEDWQAIYGPIQENLSSFYQNLTPETVVASGLKNLETQYNAAQDQIQRTFAQRGIDSPAQDMMNQQAALGMAEARADIRTNMPLQAATAQQGFLNQQVTNPATAGISNALGNQATMYGQTASAQAANAAAGYQALGGIAQQGISQYTQYQQQQAIAQQQQWNNLAMTSATNPGFAAYSPTTGAPVAASTGWEML